MASILVVDDYPGNLALAKRRLSQGGHEVQVSLDAETALELIESGSHFDLFILDVVLPGMSGFDLCQELRQRDDTKETPVLFMTGERHEIPDRLAGFASGANDYLMKPVDPRELLARVNVLLALRDALREAKNLNQELGLLVKKRTRALKQALDRIGKQHALLESMVNQLPASVVVHDDRGRLVTANAVAERIFKIAAPGSKLKDGALEPFFSKQNWPKESRENHWAHAVTTGEGKRRRRFEAERTQLDSEEPRWLLHIVDVTERDELLEQYRRRDVADLLQEIEVLKDELHGRYKMSRVIGVSEAMARINRVVNQLRNSRATVLIRGDTGTGKELIARAIHFDGIRSTRPFIPVHCGAIPEHLAESEFFGHSKGAFTGAIESSVGLFRQADGGTLFLDEIGECPLEVQGKLLRVLESGEIRPVGSAKVSCVQTRLIAATNRDLRQMVKDGRFREDLYYRLDVVAIDVPSLRERKEDIPVLASHFLKKHAVFHRRGGNWGLSREALAFLESYDWPGNIRELENVFVYALQFATGPVVQIEDLPTRMREQARASARGENVLRVPNSKSEGSLPRESSRTPLASQKKMAEREAILATLRQLSGQKRLAAKELGIGKSSLYRKIKEYGISDQEIAG